MADLNFKRGPLEDLEDVSLVDGQMLFVTDQDEVEGYIDYNDGTEVVRKPFKSGDKVYRITQAAYDALPSTEKNSGKIYYITDADAYSSFSGDMFKSIYDPDEDGVVTASESANTVNGHTVESNVPANAVFTDHTYSTMTGATASANGTGGLLPAPAAGDNEKFFAGDGTWKSASTNATTVNNHTVLSDVPANAVFTDTTYSAMTGASSTTDGTSGLTPQPLTGDEDSYLKGDGTWHKPVVKILQADYDELTTEEKNNGVVYYIEDADSYAESAGDMFKSIYDSDEDGKVDAAENADTVNGHTVESNVPAGAVFTDHTYSVMTGATSSAGGTSGLVPTPTSNDTNKFLGGNGQWGMPFITLTQDEYDALSSAEKQNGKVYYIEDSNYYSLDLITEINNLKARVTALENS